MVGSDSETKMVVSRRSRCQPNQAPFLVDSDRKMGRLGREGVLLLCRRRGPVAGERASPARLPSPPLASSALPVHRPRAPGPCPQPARRGLVLQHLGWGDPPSEPPWARPIMHSMSTPAGNRTFPGCLRAVTVISLCERDGLPRPPHQPTFPSRGPSLGPRAAPPPSWGLGNAHLTGPGSDLTRCRLVGYPHCARLAHVGLVLPWE